MQDIQAIEDKKTHHRIFGLDLVRAFAILLVVFGHGQFLLDGSSLEGFPYFRFIDGVDIFFVLSGFLIGGILLKELNSESVFTPSKLLTFWKRRWFRTLPNYYLILLLNYLVVRYGITNEDITQFNFSFLIFTQNFIEPFQGFFWESWSLSIEEWFYIFAPVLVFILLRFTSAKKAYLITTCLMILAPLLYRYSILDPSVSRFYYDLIFRKTVVARLDSIGYGLLAAWFMYYYKFYWKKLKYPAFLLGCLFVVFILNYHSTHTSLYRQVFYFSLTPISVLLTLPVFANFNAPENIFTNTITHISKISYSMYLINLALVAEVIRDNFAPDGNLDAILKYGLYWLLVIGCSTLLYRYFEKPMMNLRDRF